MPVFFLQGSVSQESEQVTSCGWSEENQEAVLIFFWQTQCPIGPAECEQGQSKAQAGRSAAALGPEEDDDSSGSATTNHYHQIGEKSNVVENGQN